MVLGQAVNLKKKARIKVPKSCVLIGVIDERGLLNEGEIFVRIQRESYEKYAEEEDPVERKITKIEETVSGNVIVTKNPCSHPGDIRLLKAIGEDDERFYELDHLVNVVVFPAKGYRPEQQKMSGGDLDGDVYMVIWEPTIVEKV